MSVTIEIAYRGDLRTEARHLPSGSLLLTDAPLDNKGKGEMFSPTDLVATALASCVLTMMGMAAQRHDINLRGATARVDKHMVNTPARRIGRLEIVVRVPGPLAEKQRRLLERFAHACPVKNSLAAEVETPMRFEWGE